MTHTGSQYDEEKYPKFTTTLICKQSEPTASIEIEPSVKVKRFLA